MYPFDYHRPGSLDAVSRLLADRDDPKLLAGGMTLLPTMKQRLAAPSDLIDLSAVEALIGIDKAGDGLTIGAMTTHAAVAGSDLVRATIPALARLASGIGHAQVRHRGTLGGSLANNDPAADYPAAVLGLAATVRTQKREIAADDFFTGMFDTALDDDEFITAVHFPVPRCAAYEKFPNPASKYAIAGVFVAETDGGIRVAVTGAAACVYRATAMERALATSFSPSALDGIDVDYGEFNDDLHASAEYRGQLVKVMARRAVEAAGG